MLWQNKTMESIGTLVALWGCHKMQKSASELVHYQLYIKYGRHESNKQKWGQNVFIAPWWLTRKSTSCQRHFSQRSWILGKLIIVLYVLLIYWYIGLNIWLITTTSLLLHGTTKLTGIHHLESMNVVIHFHEKPLISYWAISAWTKVMDRPILRSIEPYRWHC